MLVRRRSLILAACAFGAATYAAALAQESRDEAALAPPQTSPEHARMKEWAGEWKAVMTSPQMPGMEFQGRMKARLDYNGFWLVTDFEADLAGTKMRGQETLGYDPTTKKYRSVWIDSMSPLMTQSEGKYDAATRTLTMYSEEDGPGVTKVLLRHRSIDQGSDQWTYVQERQVPGGDAWVEAMRVVYDRAE